MYGNLSQRVRLMQILLHQLLLDDGFPIRHVQINIDAEVEDRVTGL